ncbi:MAG: phosphoglycerate dehydrogenase [Brevundimonas sp.]|uniref:phosphoglycerate dehydrogenase n=1 Tax=Brevundimonas sp. TaxID=1871086 RepID=UPI0039189284
MGRWSYPRSRIRVLLLEGVHPLAVRRLTDEGYSVEVRDGALDEAALIEAVRGVHVLGVRSKSEVSARVIEAADRLLAVGAFCIGVNQIDLEACRRRGIAVFNAPHSNTRSVVELAIGHIIALSRGVIDHDRRMKSGLWQKSASGAHEVRGKTLGIVGYGAIGTQLSVLAETLGMSVVFHDLVERLALGNAWRARTLDEVLRVSDVVSLHVDGRASNAHLIGAREITAMKRGAALINLSRGHVLDLDAAAEALRSGQLSGLALDVYPHEPAANGPGFECPLAGLANVILTPHIGGSTEEAQAAIADFAAERLLAYLGRGDTTFCVNLPNVQLAEVSGAHRILHIHENRPGVLADLNRALSEAGLNILGQHLKTLDDVGYVITDVDADYDPAHMRRLKDNPATLRFRLLY